VVFWKIIRGVFDCQSSNCLNLIAKNFKSGGNVLKDQFVKLKDQGYKLTKQRREILEALDDSPPLAADEIFNLVKKRCGVNLSTIYRNLSILQKMGLIRKVNSLGQSDQYELVKCNCQHVVECLKCGAKVVFSECFFDQMIREVESKTHYKIKKHTVEFYGTCPNCAC
jgi:Fur family ferric uptake transcriptional regulator